MLKFCRVCVLAAALPHADGSIDRGRPREVTIGMRTAVRQQEQRRFVRLPAEQWRLDLTRFDTQSLPLSMGVVSSSLILILASGHVVALDPATREARWRLSSDSLGLSPRVAVGGSSPTLVLLGGPGQSPVVVNSSNGTVVERWRGLPTTPLESGCHSSVHSLLLASVDTGASLLGVDDHGTVRARRQLPFAEYRAAHPLVRQALLATGEGSNGCVVALALGGEIGLMDERGVVWTRPYLEPVIPPRVLRRTTALPSGGTAIDEQLSDRRLAVRSLASAGRLIFVAFEGSTQMAGRLVDLYVRETGQYAGTLLFPHPVQGLAADRERLFVASFQGGYPVLQAFALPR